MFQNKTKKIENKLTLKTKAGHFKFFHFFFRFYFVKINLIQKLNLKSEINKRQK